jgi:hypothetical protein
MVIDGRVKNNYLMINRKIAHRMKQGLKNCQLCKCDKVNIFRYFNAKVYL